MLPMPLRDLTYPEGCDISLFSFSASFFGRREEKHAPDRPNEES
jgi:hypothetical protein